MERSSKYAAAVQRRHRAGGRESSPGKATLAESLAANDHPAGEVVAPDHLWAAPTGFVDEDIARAHGLVQFDPSARAGRGDPDLDGEDARTVAASGFTGGGGPLPMLDRVQASFGHHDVGGVRAHVGGAAAEASDALGARAYASEDQVAFASPPDLFLVAHEAAHVVQQRGGVQLSGGLGRAGDEHERHADAVAGAVVRGESAEPLLDRYQGGGPSSAVQRHPGDDEPLRERTRQQQVTVSEDFESFRAAVTQWLAREVMSRTDDAHRENPLVDASNLADLHHRLVENERVGQQVTLEARLIPGAHRYERVEFRIPGLTLLDTQRIEGRAPDTPRIRRQIEELRRRRRQLVRTAETDVREALRMANHAALSGSRNYRADAATERFRQIAWLQTFIDRCVGGPSGPDERFADNYMQAYELREMERMADQAMARADRSVEAVNSVDQQLRGLHEEIGQEYEPEDAPEVPDVRL